MRLSAKLISDYTYINNFDFACDNTWKITAGEPQAMYFQIIDQDKHDLRRLLGIGSSNTPFSVSVVLRSIDDSKVITVQAIQADSNDASIFYIPLAKSQKPFSGNVQFTVTEGSVSRSFVIKNGLNVTLLNDGSC